MLRRFARPVTATVATSSFAALSRRWATDIKVPFIAESVDTGKIAEIAVAVGDYIEEDALLMKVDSDKQAVDILAPHSGTVTKLPQDGQTVKVDDLIAAIEKGDAPAGSKKQEEKKAAAETKKEEPKKEEVKKQDSAPAPSTPKPAAPTPPRPSQVAQPAAASGMAQRVAIGSDPRVSHEKISSMRQRIADRLKASQNTAAMLTTFNEIDMTELIKLRAKYKDQFHKRHGVKLGFMSPFVKASATALQEVPIINASWGDGVIEYHKYVDISVAVAAKNGLVVPVLRDVQDMNFADIEKKIEEFGTKAKAGKITIPEMLGGTFTISNGGTFGSWMGTPIINPPQSAILGMHATKKKAWVDAKGELCVRDIMAVALTYDHRLIDGRDAVTFLVKIKNLIEDPARLVLDLP